MERHHSRSPAKRVPATGTDSYNLSSMIIGQSAGKHDAPPPATNDAEQKKQKLSREDVSRCINIWATIYLGHGRQDARDLHLPSRPWMGRSPGSLKPFE